MELTLDALAGLTPEQQALRESVADLLRRHPARLDEEAGEAGAAEANAELWRRLAGIGAAGLAIPERYGGAGAGPVETSIVAEELGRTLAPVPLLGSAVLAAQAILGSGDEQACQRLLPGIASGSRIAALAWTGARGGWDPAAAACHAERRVQRDGEADGIWTLTGTAHYVLDGDVADVLIVAASLPEGGIGLFEAATDRPGVERQAAAGVDQTRRLATIRLATGVGPPLTGAAPTGPAPTGAAPTAATTATTVGTQALTRARDLACVALSAEQVGAAARALELTVAYTKQRIQFGRPIASFQAVQHRLAELHALVQSARALAYRAAQVAASGASQAEVGLLAAAAKSCCSDVLAKVAAEAIQLHGAIGVTWEYDAHRYFKRAHGSGQLFGPPAAHLARIADAVIGPAEPLALADDLAF
ncbi:MAG TPA: acyl-CoA dehydrogenase family protein [Streptosporangiaceae bacterium]|nr:acyl-CoA dehydrogenase family protein [Streptosporangiaceae bacterium]